MIKNDKANVFRVSMYTHTNRNAPHMHKRCDFIGLLAVLTQSQKRGEQQSKVSAFRMIRAVAVELGV